jgi:hypothetical protein
MKTAIGLLIVSVIAISPALVFAKSVPPGHHAKGVHGASYYAPGHEKKRLHMQSSRKLAPGHVK